MTAAFEIATVAGTFGIDGSGFFEIAEINGAFGDAQGVFFEIAEINGSFTGDSGNLTPSIGTNQQFEADQDVFIAVTSLETGAVYDVGDTYLFEELVSPGGAGAAVKTVGALPLVTTGLPAWVRQYRTDKKTTNSVHYWHVRVTRGTQVVNLYRTDNVWASSGFIRGGVPLITDDKL